MTKKKTLLKEGTVRQFMKLANLQPLASGFVDKLYETGAKKDGESKGDKGKDKKDPEAKDYTDGGDREGDESKTHAGEDYEKEKCDENLDVDPDTPPGPVDAFNEQEEEDAGEELDMGAEEGPEGEEEEFEVEEEGGDVDVNALVRAIAAAIETETGVSVDVAEEGDEEEVDLGDEEEVELGGEEEEGGEELDFGEEEEVLGEEEGLEEIISTIAENVTNRLKKMTEAKKKKLSKRKVVKEGSWEQDNARKHLLKIFRQQFKALGYGDPNQTVPKAKEKLAGLDPQQVLKIYSGYKEKKEKELGQGGPKQDPYAGLSHDEKLRKLGFKGKPGSKTNPIDTGTQVVKGKTPKMKAKSGYDDITAAVRKMPGLADFAGGQKHVDALATKLGLKPGRPSKGGDYWSYPSMKSAILRALKGGETRKPAYAKKPMSGDPEPDEPRDLKPTPQAKQRTGA